MADRGIIFSGAMVRALLDGRKTQTRRLLNPQPHSDCVGFRRVFADHPYWEATDAEGRGISPFPYPKNGMSASPRQPYAIGDRLYVREAWTARMTHGWTIADARSRMYREEIQYRADGHHSIDGWWPSIHMPREFSRLWLLVTDVRVQRVQDISEADAETEGVEMIAQRNYRDGFAVLWNSLHTKRGERWDDNPWIVAVTFEVNRGNIDTNPPAASDAAPPSASAAHALPSEAGQRTSTLSIDDSEVPC